MEGIQAIPEGVALVLAFCKLFPEHWFKHYKFAMVEDLINSPPFCSYSARLAEHGEAWDGPLGLISLQVQCDSWQELGMGAKLVQ